MTDTTASTPVSTDEPTAAEIKAAGVIRPLDQLPSPWIVKGEPSILSQPTIEALSPADQKVVMERAGSGNPDAISRALNGFLRERQRDLRIRCGAGEGATATEAEALDQLNQVRLLTEESKRIESELADVREHRTEYDDNGNPLPVPVYSVQGGLRTAREFRLAEITDQLALISGIEGAAALTQAARKDALKARELFEQTADRAEIKRRAEQMVREERLDAAARAQAKFLKGNLG